MTRKVASAVVKNTDFLPYVVMAIAIVAVAIGIGMFGTHVAIGAGAFSEALSPVTGA